MLSSEQRLTTSVCGNLLYVQADCLTSHADRCMECNGGMERWNGMEQPDKRTVVGVRVMPSHIYFHWQECTGAYWE